MDKQVIHQLHSDFERCAHTYEASGDEAGGVEYWFARDLQKLLGYSQWRNFEPVIEKAIAACINAGEHQDDHFASARKMVDIGSSAQKEVDEIALTRYACYPDSRPLADFLPTITIRAATGRSRPQAQPSGCGSEWIR